MMQKSEVLNLGVLDENPSSTDGVISIMDYLSGLVPMKPNGEPYAIITHCDGGAFEKMVSARKARAPDRNPVKQLLGIEPSAQEFHKRGVVLQGIVETLWQHPREETIAQVTDALVVPDSEHLNLCDLDIPDELLMCSNANCSSGGVFDRACVEVVTGEIPDPAEDWWCSPDCHGYSRFCVCKRHIEGSGMVESNSRKKCDHGLWFHLKCVGLDHLPDASAIWYCPACKPPSEDEDCVHNYSKALLWMLLNDQVRRTAIRTGHGPMLMEFWKDDGIHFWNENHNKYLILMHRMIADTNGWLSERQAADLIWNRTVNIHGGIGRNVAMDKVNEFLNNDFKENLKRSNGKYTASQIQRSSFIAGGVARDLDNVFAANVAKTRIRRTTAKRTLAHNESVNKFKHEYREDYLFDNKPGRHHNHFKHFSVKFGEIKKPVELKKRLLKYSAKLDRGRFASQKTCP